MTQENNDSSPKRPRTDNMFPSVGEQAERADHSQEPELVESKDLATTGATDASGRPVQVLESLCMNCHQQGETKLLFTSISGFREVVIMSFECPHCGFKSNEIQSAAEIQEKGVKYTVKIESVEELARQVVKSEHSAVLFPELDVEIPPASGRVTTIEGLLSAMLEDLSRDQIVRQHVDPDLYQKVQEVCQRLENALNGSLMPLTMILDDPSGNSFVASSPEELASNKFKEQKYFRTATQSRQIGLDVPPGQDHRNESMAAVVNEEESVVDHDNGGEFDTGVVQDMRDEVQTFEGACPACHSECPTKMKMVNIPHFKDVIIMSTVCHSCGYKSNEVKTGGAIPDKGRRVTLKIVEQDDLSRDILKSETCKLKFPELELDLEQGTLGGRFTTVEGLLKQVYEELETKVFNQGDSMDEDTKRRWLAFLARLDTAIQGFMPFTIIMDDPLAASYIQNVYAPDPDPSMTIEDYERTPEENEDLGLTDMNV